MAIPDYQSCMLLLLRMASDCREHRIRDAVRKVADEFGLTGEERRDGGTLVICRYPLL